jgi:hypothetical protein
MSTFSSRIHPKDGVVYYNLVIVNGEPVGEFYATEEDAMEGARMIYESLGGNGEEYRDGEGEEWAYGALLDELLGDDRVAYADLCVRMVIYE